MITRLMGMEQEGLKSGVCRVNLFRSGLYLVWDPKASARTAGRPSLRARWEGLCKPDLEAFPLQLRPRVGASSGTSATYPS